LEKPSKVLDSELQRLAVILQARRDLYKPPGVLHCNAAWLRWQFAADVIMMTEYVNYSVLP